MYDNCHNKVVGYLLLVMNVLVLIVRTKNPDPLDLTV